MHVKSKSSLDISWMVCDSDTDDTLYLGVESSADLKWNSHVEKVTPRETQCWKSLAET